MRCYFIILVLILFLDCQILFAQDISFASKEKEQRLAMNRQEAMDTAMKAAEKKTTKRINVRKQAPRPHPYLTYEVSYNDNIDTVAAKKSTLINRITPGVKMNFRGRANSLKLDTRLINNFYHQRSSADSYGAQTDILATFGIWRYTLSIANDYLNNYHLAKQPVTVGADAQIDWKNTFNMQLGRDFNRLGFGIGYKRIDYDYISSQRANDNTEETISFNPYLRLAKKTRALLEYSHKRIKYATGLNPDDSDNNDFNLSLTSVLSAKLSGLAKIGYKLTEQKVSDDSRDVTFATAIGYRMSERSNLAFIFKRISHEESNEPDYYTENYFKLSANYRPAFNQKFNLFFSYTADSFDYLKKVGLIGKSHNYIWETELTYAFRQWLDFSLKYKSSQVVSNVDSEYDRNEITFKTQARF